MEQQDRNIYDTVKVLTKEHQSTIILKKRKLRLKPNIQLILSIYRTRKFEVNDYMHENNCSFNPN